MSEVNNAFSFEDKQFLLEHSRACSIMSEGFLNKHNNNVTCCKCGKLIVLGDIFCRSSRSRSIGYLCMKCYKRRLIDIPDIPVEQLCKELGLPMDYIDND